MQALLQKIEELNKYIHEEGEKGLLEGLKEFMEANPTVQAVRWEQYAPYFNDGDPCVFGIYAPQFRIFGISDDAKRNGDYEDGWFLAWRDELEEIKDNAIELEKALQTLEPVLKMISEDAQITYVRGAESLLVEDVSHD